jgi:hypothetical protein
MKRRIIEHRRRQRNAGNVVGGRGGRVRNLAINKKTEDTVNFEFKNELANTQMIFLQKKICMKMIHAATRQLELRHSSPRTIESKDKCFCFCPSDELTATFKLQHSNRGHVCT